MENIEKLRVEFEKLVANDSTLEPPCGKANCLVRDPYGFNEYRDKYMEGAFRGFCMAQKDASEVQSWS